MSRVSSSFIKYPLSVCGKRHGCHLFPSAMFEMTQPNHIITLSHIQQHKVTLLQASPNITSQLTNDLATLVMHMMGSVSLNHEVQGKNSERCHPPLFLAGYRVSIEVLSGISIQNTQKNWENIRRAKYVRSTLTDRFKIQLPLNQCIITYQSRRFFIWFLILVQHTWICAKLATCSIIIEYVQQ